MSGRRRDFLMILSKVSRGSVQEKLQWVFGLYDQNGDGLITQNEMLDVVSSIYEMLGRSTDPVVEEGSAREHVEKIFHVRNTFLDFLMILSKVSRGSVQEKLQWVFGLYDQNGDGLITQNEMLDVVSSIYEMLGRSTDPVVEEGSAREHVEKIFHVRNTFL
ncbi:hypothetical protein J437_LFUL011559, partial [Ladona fulva]